MTRLADVLAEPRYADMAAESGLQAGQLSIRSYLAVPVIARSGEVIGGLIFGHPQPNVFGERAERLVVGIAAQAANAIDNARLYDAAKRAAEERARLLDAERATRTELEWVSLMKDEFLATLSLELRTPLNAVLGWSEISTPSTTRSTKLTTRRAAMPSSPRRCSWSWRRRSWCSRGLATGNPHFPRLSQVIKSVAHGPVALSTALQARGAAP